MHDYAPYLQSADYFLAVPSNASDPLSIEWSVVGVLANMTSDDPTGAWRSAAGEWRFAGARGTVYATAPGAEFTGPWNESSRPVFMPPTFNASQGGISCGDLFPLPAVCDGCGPAAAGDPTHVYKVLMEGPDGSGGDWFWFGNYSDGAVGSGGVWAPEPWDGAGVQWWCPGGFAAKSFYDPARAERVQWTAIGAGAGVLGLPADLRWHPRLHRLVASPVPALASLRSLPPLFEAPALTVPAGGALWLGDWPPGAGNASELGVTFALPAAAEAVGVVSFGVAVLVGGSPAPGTGNASVTLLVSFDAASFTANLTVGAQVESLYMPGFDLPGGDYVVTNVNYT